MHTPRAESRIVLLFAVVAAAATAAILHRSNGRVPVVSEASSWRAIVDLRPSVPVAGRYVVVLRTPSLAQRVAAAGGAVEIEQEQLWTKAAETAQKLLLTRLALQGLVVHPEERFARVLDGFSAALSPDALALVERDRDVAGVYPVRAAYPATTSVSTLAAQLPAPLASAGVDGRGVSIAVIDAGEHATRMDGILARVAPGAEIVSVGIPAPARSDELIAGLDRAVDPNGDGDAHDGARIALVAYEEPFAGFPDGPEAQAVAGASALDLLVVAPSGNDGAAGDAFGDVAAPGAAPDALTVGALDTRPSTARARVVVRSGLRTLFDAEVPLALAASTDRALSLQLVAAHGSFFTQDGESIVAGRAVLAAAGSAPASVAERAARAGAAAVLLYGAAVPPASLEVEKPVPVVSLPRRIAHAVLARVRAGATVEVMLGPQRDAGNGAEGTIAPFSSTGLAYDGSVKPDLVAPGVAVPSTGRLAVDGSSAAAAVVAGDAALLAQVRPALGANALAGLLVGTAQAVPGAGVPAQGAGAVDVAAAAAGELAASPAALTLGVSSAPGRTVRASFTLTNLSTRPLPVTLGIRTQDEGAAAITFSLGPKRLVLAPGRSRLVHLVAVTASRAVGTRTTDGAVVVSVAGGGEIRVPWAIAYARPASLIRAVTLSHARLIVDAGNVLDVAGRREIRPLERLDVELRRAGGPEMGLLARVRDVLPGRYVFGITGRGPAGATLQPGRYLVTVVAYPTDGGSPSRRTVGFGLR